MAQVVAAQGVFDGGLQKSQLIAGVITGARKGIGIDPFAVGHEAQGIGELNFAAFSGLDAAQDFKDIRRQDIAAEGGQAARCFVDGRFFNHVDEPHDAFIFRRHAVDDAVA
ncbi:hypothetical protein HMPREF3201_02213 [Megasphaera sp. MJR8396C]|nr:hypothetical protein HMPREF3201_02213 [Megasphaera sp. MJR8396C]